MQNEIRWELRIFPAKGACEQLVNLFLTKTCVKNAVAAVRGSNHGQRVAGGSRFLKSDAVVTVEQVGSVKDLSAEVAGEPEIWVTVKIWDGHALDLRIIWKSVTFDTGLWVKQTLNLNLFTWKKSCALKIGSGCKETTRICMSFFWMKNNYIKEVLVWC